MNSLFFIFATSTCLGAIAVVVSQSVVRMAFWLVVSLGSVAGLFFLADADFVAATQLLIYVGGTLVLLIFGIMLTASGPALKLKTPPAEIATAVVVGFLFLLTVFSTISTVDWSQEHIAAVQREPGFDDRSEGSTLKPLGLALLGVRPDKPGASGYLLPFEIVSIHLLAVLIGAAYLARAKQRADSRRSNAAGTKVVDTTTAGTNAVGSAITSISENSSTSRSGDANHGE